MSGKNRNNQSGKNVVNQSNTPPADAKTATETTATEGQKPEEGGQPAVTTTRGETATFQHVDEAAFIDKTDNGEKTGDQAGQPTTGETTTETPEPGVLLGTVVTKPTPSEPEAVEQATAPAPVPSPSRQPTTNLHSTMIEKQLSGYIEAMAPSVSLDPAIGGQWQNSLFNLVRTTLNKENPEDFRREWNTILNIFHKNREGVFHENYVMRFGAFWNLSASECAQFRRIIAVIKQTSDPDERANFSSVARMDALTEGFSETAKNNLSNFYA